MIAIDGKSVFRSDRSSRGGGVCIYVNNSLSPFCKVDPISCNISPDLEIMSINLKKPGLKDIMKIASMFPKYSA